MTQGSAVQPGYGGSGFFPVATGTLIKMTPRPKRSPHQGRCGESRAAVASYFALGRAVWTALLIPGCFATRAAQPHFSA